MTSDREFSVILEDLRSEFRTFGEGLADVRRVLKTHTNMIASNTEEISRNSLQIKTNHHQILERLDRIELRLARVET